MTLPATKIIQNFDDAASGYDRQALMQAAAAEHLVGMAQCPTSPHTILDIGSGTGFVAKAAADRWPLATITALDNAPEMLRLARHKVPHLKVITADAQDLDTTVHYDMIFSSMMLHWMPNPRGLLQHWQKALKPDGKLYVALLVDGSFQEWRTLCLSQNIEDGLWPMPAQDMARGLAIRSEEETLKVPFASAYAFLKRLKDTGAATARQEHKPVNTASMRQLLQAAPKPFGVTYKILYLELSSGKV
ncbi:MAG: methyltransferase domain-containing protein [Alphaproteobacteria bacterium]